MIVGPMLTRATFKSLIEEAEQVRSASADEAARIEASRAIPHYEAALALMEQLNLTELPQLGTFGSKDLTRHMQVKVRKGALISTTDPKFDIRNNPKIARRDHIVTLTHVYAGHIDTHWHPHKARYAFTNQQVEWVGSGGYWCRTDSHHVEAVKQTS